MTTNLLSSYCAAIPRKTLLLSAEEAGRNDISRRERGRDVFLTALSSVEYSIPLDEESLKQLTKEKGSRHDPHSRTHSTPHSNIFDDSIPPTWPHIKKVDRDNIVIGFFLTAIVSCIWWSKGCITSIFVPRRFATPFEKVYLRLPNSLSLSLFSSLLSKD